MNPRLSLQGRMSIDGWTGVSPGGPRAAQHGRQSSLYRSQTNTLFNAFDEHENGGHGHTEAVGLRNLREEEETDDDDDEDEDLALKYDERTHLRKTKVQQHRTASRSNSHSPIPAVASDVRIASR